MEDLFDEFLEFDVTMGGDVIECPHCGAEVPCSLLIDDEITCPECGQSFKTEN